MERTESSMVLNKEALLDRVGGDLEFLDEITRVFLDGRQQLLSEIKCALSGGDAQALARATHTLKGCVANLAAGAAFEAAQRLEALARQGELSQAAEAYAALETEVVRFEQALLNLAGELSNR